MRAWLVVVCGLVACKDKPSTQQAPASTAPRDAMIVAEHPPIPVDAAPPPDGDWATCQRTLQLAAKAPATRRVGLLLDGCQPCGDWKPLLDWQKLQEHGGPTRQLIEERMAGCKAWCTPNAKARFMGTLDDARVKKSRTPWRELANQCKDEVSARPDGRYLEATYFALDRIARWAAQQPDGAAALAPVVIPLPAVTQTGVGVTLPETGVTKPEIVGTQITLTPTTISVGALPTATLTANGVEPQGDPYPGAPLTKATKVTGRVAVFAHPTVAASRLLEVTRLLPGVPLVLAVRSSVSSPGWEQHGIAPIDLVAGKPTATVLVLDATGDAAIATVKQLAGAARTTPITIQLAPTATIASLATLLGVLGYFEVTTATITPKSK